MDKETLKEATRVALLGWADKDRAWELLWEIRCLGQSLWGVIWRAAVLLILRPIIMVLAPISIPALYFAFRYCDRKDREAVEKLQQVRAAARAAFIQKLKDRQ